MISAVFKLAKQQGYFEGENPARDTAVNPNASGPAETYAYTLEEIQSVLAVSERYMVARDGIEQNYDGPTVPFRTVPIR